jgi:hypothetical protein
VARPPPNLPRTEVFRQLLDLLNERAEALGMLPASPVPGSPGELLARSVQLTSAAWVLSMEKDELKVVWNFNVVTSPFLPLPSKRVDGTHILPGEEVELRIPKENWKRLLHQLREAVHKPIESLDLDF